MNPSIPFETALAILAMTYASSLILLLAVSNVAIAVIETFEEIATHHQNPKFFQ
jgi:hypothetical protein